MAEVQIDWRRPAGVPYDLVALWYDPAWRDADAASTLRLRKEVISKLRGPREEPRSRGGAEKGVAAILGLATLASLFPKK